MTLKYKINNQILHAVGDLRPTIELSKNLVYLDLAFDEEWDGATVTVVFENSSLPDAEGVARLWTGDAVEVPPEVLVNGDIRIGCIGLKADGSRMTTERMKSGIYICRAGGALLLANGAAEMTPELWEQCVAAAGAANEAAKDATAAKDDLLAARDSGEFDGQDGTDGGYYSPAVTQPDANTMRISFTPSKADMPFVQDTDITIPSGGSGSVAVDSTLTVEGQAADAKATGDAIRSLSEEIANIQSGGSGTNTGISNDYKWIAKGQMREPVRDFQGWAHGVQFDKELGVAVCMIISGEGSHSNKAPYYRATIEPTTGYMSEYEEVKVYDADGNELSDCGYFSSFNILSDGTYIMTDLYRRFFTSADKGYTWNYSHTVTMENEADNCTIWGITELTNGRWIASNGGHDNSYGGTFYSDNKGLTWTRVVTTSVSVSGTDVSFPEGVTPFEAVFIEIGGGRVVQYARATNNGRTAASVDGKPRSNLEPALFAVSDDYGETWTTFIPSASITDMTCCNGKVVVDGDTVHFLYCSRYLYTTDPTGKQRSGAVFYAKSTLNDVYNDVWEKPVAIDYGHWDAETAAVVTDIGYPSLWMDDLGNLNGVYYDSAESTGENAAYNANWRYLFGSPVMNQSPVSSRGKGSMVVSYSQEMVDALLSALKAECDANILTVKTELEKKIAAIVVGGGGELPGDEESTDGSLYVLNGLIDTWDFTNEANYDTENLFVKSEYGKLRMKRLGSDLAYNQTYGGVEGKQVLVVADLENNPSSSWLPQSAEGVTFEEVFKSGGTGSYILGMQGDNDTVTMFSETRKVYPADGAIVVDSDTTAWFAKGNLRHVAITFTSGEMKLYENGALTYTLTAENAGITAFDIDYIKTQAFVVNRQNVYTKTVRVYDRALSEAEIVNNFTYENNLHSIVA